MDSNKDTDFTFSQVSASLNQSGFDEPTVTSGMSNISIEEESVSSNNGDQVALSSIRLPDKSSVKEDKVGSFSFRLMSVPPLKQLNGASKQAELDGGLGSLKRLDEWKPVVKEPAARSKVPFEKGYSPMDWLHLIRAHPDLAGLRGQSNKRLISMSEVKQHQSEGSMWTVLKGRVYNISKYMKFHPGGVDMLMKAVGKDCTSLFNKYHAWVNAEFLLEKCLVGILDETSEQN